ncbi:hypothetical protein ACP4OV_008941 [Aristida adscensionis]
MEHRRHSNGGRDSLLAAPTCSQATALTDAAATAPTWRSLKDISYLITRVFKKEKTGNHNYTYLTMENTGNMLIWPIFISGFYLLPYLGLVLDFGK